MKKEKKTGSDLFDKPEIVRDVINSLSSHIALIDEKGFIIAVNKSWQLFSTINGLKSPNFGIGLNYLNIAEATNGSDAEFGKKISSAIKEVLAGNIKYYSMVYPCHSPLEKQWYKVVVTPFKNDSISGGAVISHRDITENFLIKEELHKSEARYQYLFDHASDGIFLFDENLQIKNVNEAACRQVGYSACELSNMVVNDLFFVEDLKVRPIRIKELSLGENIINERKFRRKDGSFLEVEINSKKLPNGSYQGICRDISERKRNEKLLASKENYIHTILNSDPECIKLISEDGICLSMNPAGLNMLELNNEKMIIGKPILGFICPDHQDVALQLLAKVFRGESATMEYEITTINGKIKWLEAQAVPFRDPEGNIESCLWISRDITERIKDKQALQKAHLRLKKSFTNIQSIIENERKEISRELHDELGQKLTALNLDIAWLSKKFQPDHFEEKAVIVEMKDILSSLLETIQRISKNLRPPILEQLDLEDAIEWLVTDFEKRSKIQCTLNINTDNAGKEESIKVNVFRILQESLTNIMRHSNASKVFISLKEIEGQLNVEVSDNGQGISEAQLKNVNSLGLIGIKERIDSLQGSFIISGIPGKGTKLQAIIPVN
jgi:two-component system sensor histidine kinase UhpB